MMTDDDEEDIRALVDAPEMQAWAAAFARSCAEYADWRRNHPPRLRIIEKTTPCAKQCQGCLVRGVGPGWCDFRYCVEEDGFAGTELVAFGFPSRADTELFVAGKMKAWATEFAH